MALEKIPIHVFVANRYSSLAVQKIVEGWRIEPAEVIERLIEHFREMGVYEVPYGHEPMMIENMLIQLRHSPEILKMVQRMRSEELRRQRARHAD